MPDLEALAQELSASIAELAAVAGADFSDRPRGAAERPVRAAD